jgi:SAM-dependent methyltransferase
LAQRSEPGTDPGHSGMKVGPWHNPILTHRQRTLPVRCGWRHAATMQEAMEFWNQHYRDHLNIWHGRANVHLVGVAGSRPAATALDLGCGEGGDAFWLAEHGWLVTAVDISTVALDRVRAEADRRGLAIDCRQHDLTKSFPSGSYDLVSAQFVQSPLEFDRTPVLRAAAAAVRPGGLLLIVDHAATAPWSWDPDYRSAGPGAVLDSMNLDPQGWCRLRAEQVQRRAFGPHHEVATVTDDVILLLRAAS